jgi:hypothetical protein
VSGNPIANFIGGNFGENFTDDGIFRLLLKGTSNFRAFELTGLKRNS